MFTRQAFILAIDLEQQLRADTALSWSERVARDREFAPPAGAEITLDHLKRWWAVHGKPAAEAGARLHTLRSVVLLTLLTVSVLSGAGLAAATLAYDGSEPINLAPIVAIFVLLQLVLVLMSVLLVPSLRLPIETLREASPGAIGLACLRRRLPAARALSRDFLRWQSLYWSQCAGAAFNLAALATMAALMTFSDLAFGWSSTLPLSTDTLRSLVEWTAAPWAAWLPAAVPDTSVIAASRFVRGPQASELDPGALRQWWSFVLLAVACWGLAPRLALLGMSAAGLRRAARRMVLEQEEVQALRARMRTPLVEHDGSSLETPPTAHPSIPSSSVAPGETPVPGVIWGDALEPSEASRRIESVATGELFNAGGSASLAQDDETLAALRALNPATVLIFTRGWEPPLLEQMDFAEQLADPMQVVFVPINGDDALRPGERQAWSDAITRLANPAVAVTFES